jgi:predicted protein tyrosine phosphatase
MSKKATKNLTILWRRITEQGLRVTTLWAVDHVVRIVTGAPIRRVSQVTPQLHVGGQHRARGRTHLEARGIVGIVNMRIEFDDAAAGIEGERYVYLPTVDDAAPSMEHLRAGVEFIAEVIEGGGSVYVHCGSGVGRAPTMAAAYLVSTGLSPREAWATIRGVRPFIRPTPVQVAQLERFAEAYD